MWESKREHGVGKGRGEEKGVLSRLYAESSEPYAGLDFIILRS